MTVDQQLQIGIKELDKAKITSSRIDTELLMALVLGTDRTWVKVHGEKELTKAQITDFSALIQRRADRTPLVHLTGTREFYGLELQITPDVLTPRVETEKMVEFALKYTVKNGRVIDIGTGSGAIAIALAQQRSDLQVTATEVDQKALDVAKNNAKQHQAEISFIKSDLWDNVNGTFDTIVTNLPYLKDDADLMPEVQKEPVVALFGGGPDGLDLYRSFLVGLGAHLETGGYLFTECDPWQHEALIAEAATVGLRPVESADYFILGFIKT